MTDIVIYSAGSSHLIHNGSASTEDSSSFPITNRQYANNIHISNIRSSISSMYQQQSNSGYINIPVQPVISRTICIERNLDPMNSPNVNRRDIYSREPSETRIIERRRLSSAEQHYDYPADVIQRLRHQQNEQIDGDSSITSNCSFETTTKRAMPNIVPFNNLKPMNRLNTIFIRPTRIEQPLPKLVFQDSEVDGDDEKVESKLLETSGLDESDLAHQDSISSSLIFYEQAGLPELQNEPEKTGRRVRFSTAPIRVYPTYSPNEYDRRNEDIDPFAASAEYELEKRIENMEVFPVQIFKGPEGLGMSVLGMGVGADSGIEKLGIFVKSLNPQGLVAKDGRIQVGDQIIEVNENYMVGVTHQFATNVLKHTSGLISFLIGREKDPENSEVTRLIQRSLQIDQDRMGEQNDRAINNNQHVNENERESKSIKHLEYELTIMKECFTSMEKSLEEVEKERDHYQKLYHETIIQLEEIQEKYRKAMETIQELEERETRTNHEQIDRQREQQKTVQELIKKIENLEEVIFAASKANETNKVESNLEQKNSDNDSAIGASPDVAIDRLEQEDIHSTTKRSRPIERRENFGHVRSISVNSTLNFPDRTLVEPSSSSKQVSWIEYPSSIAPIVFPDQNYEYSVKNSSIHLKLPSLDTTSTVEPETPNINDSLTDSEIEVKDWTSDRCIHWLTNEGLHSFVPLFIERNIDGEKLLALDSSKMKAMGIKSSKDRDRLKLKLKQLKQTDLVQTRERFLLRPTTFERVVTQGKRLRSSSLSKLKDRHFFSTSSANWNMSK